jgi:hypothetical protein
MKPKKLKKNGKASSFDPQAFLDTAGVARKIAEFRRLAFARECFHEQV